MSRVFKQYFPKIFILLGLIEALVVFGSVFAGWELRFYSAASEPAGLDQLLADTGLRFAVMMWISMMAMGLYQRRMCDGAAGMVVRVAASVVLGTMLLTISLCFIPETGIGRGVLVWSATLVFFGICVVRLLFLRLVRQDVLKKRILVLGAGNNAKLISDLRRDVDRRGFSVLGYVAVEGEEVRVPRECLLDITVPLLQYIADNDVDELVVAYDDRRKALPVHEILDCKMSGVDVVDVIAFFERETSRLKLDIMHPSWLIFSDGFKKSFGRKYLKRAIDIGVSAVVLMLVWPLMVLVSLAIFIESKGAGPILLRQVRVGENWRLFEVFKFRSMSVDAQSDSVARWATSNDAKLTRTGAIIQKIRLDELPQIFNVLLGDMSLVGPCPEHPEFVEKLSENLPYYAERHRVKPGVSGWAQLCFPSGTSEADASQRLQYDLYYVKNHSLFLDLVIILQTLGAVFRKKGAH